jgi:hypothetical protein
MTTIHHPSGHSKDALRNGAFGLRLQGLLDIGIRGVSGGFQLGSQLRQALRIGGILARTPHMAKNLLADKAAGLTV